MNLRRFSPRLLALALAACAVPRAPATPRLTDDSTYEAATEDMQGTAWAVAPGYLVTAGHLCVSAMPGDVVWVRSSGAWFMPAHVVAFEQSTGPEADACVLRTDGPTAAPLVLAPEPPAGTADWIAGYPLGVHTVSRGHYDGHGLTSADADHGSSGGPVSDAAGVYMIVIQLRPDGKPGCAGTPIREVRRLLDAAHVPYGQE